MFRKEKVGLLVFVLLVYLINDSGENLFSVEFKNLIIEPEESFIWDIAASKEDENIVAFSTNFNKIKIV
jgi:hypothetical protein